MNSNKCFDLGKKYIKSSFTITSGWFISPKTAWKQVIKEDSLEWTCCVWKMPDDKVSWDKIFFTCTVINLHTVV